MKAKTKFPEAVKVIGPAGIGAMYWYAAALGKWAKKKSFAVLVGQKDNVKATMERVLELDPEFYYGGPHRYFGAYYAVAPESFGGDLNKSIDHYEKSLKIAPNFLGTKVLMAENYAVKRDDEELFKRLLQEVIDADPTAIPEIEPEARIEQDKARELLAQADEIF